MVAWGQKYSHTLPRQRRPFRRLNDPGLRLASTSNCAAYRSASRMAGEEPLDALPVRSQAERRVMRRPPFLVNSVPLPPGAPMPPPFCSGPLLPWRCRRSPSRRYWLAALALPPLTHRAATGCQHSRPPRPDRWRRDMALGVPARHGLWRRPPPGRSVLDHERHPGRGQQTSGGAVPIGVPLLAAVLAVFIAVPCGGGPAGPGGLAAGRHCSPSAWGARRHRTAVRAHRLSLESARKRRRNAGHGRTRVHAGGGMGRHRRHHPVRGSARCHPGTSGGPRLVCRIGRHPCCGAPAGVARPSSLTPCRRRI